MKALFILMTASFLALGSMPASAQNTDQAPLNWVPIENCPGANALGPQVYADMQAGAPAAPQEVALLVAAMRNCQNAQSASAPPPSYDAAPQSRNGLNTVLQTLGSLEQMYLQYMGARYGGSSSAGFGSSASSARSAGLTSASRSLTSYASYASHRWHRR